MPKTRYNEICVHDAIRAFRQIKTLCIKPESESEFFVEPLAEDGVLRFCSVFKQVENGAFINGTSLEVYFHLGGRKHFEYSEALLGGVNKFHLYGACGQASILQMRLFGELTQITDSELMEKIIIDILARLLGEGEDALEKPLALPSFSSFFKKIVTEGIYCFKASSFAFGRYERG
jgi:hypothetical protein